MRDTSGMLAAISTGSGSEMTQIDFLPRSVSV